MTALDFLAGASGLTAGCAIISTVLGFIVFTRQFSLERRLDVLTDALGQDLFTLNERLSDMSEVLDSALADLDVAVGGLVTAVNANTAEMAELVQTILNSTGDTPAIEAAALAIRDRLTIINAETAALVQSKADSDAAVPTA